MRYIRRNKKWHKVIPRTLLWSFCMLFNIDLNFSQLLLQICLQLPHIKPHLSRFQRHITRAAPEEKDTFIWEMGSSVVLGCANFWSIWRICSSKVSFKHSISYSILALISSSSLRNHKYHQISDCIIPSGSVELKRRDWIPGGVMAVGSGCSRGVTRAVIVIRVDNKAQHWAGSQRWGCLWGRGSGFGRFNLLSKQEILKTVWNLLQYIILIQSMI